jgi:hypothetical protein
VDLKYFSRETDPQPQKNLFWNLLKV